ncbi:MAG: hypothetical protein PUA83_05245 [Clostridiales bacterium]|nr:hypothetical protein [Clostridiales bacterium]
MKKQENSRMESRNGRMENEASGEAKVRGRAGAEKAKARLITAKDCEMRSKSPREKEVNREVYGAIDTDLARDNLENDVTFADRQDL